MQQFRGTFYFLLFSLLSCLAPPIVASPPLAELPITIDHNRTIVHLKNNDTELRFLLDTGSTTTIIFESPLTKSLHKSDGSTVMVNFPALNSVKSASRLHEVNLTYKAFNISLKNVLFINEKNKPDIIAASYDGIIGQEFFRKYITEIDPFHKTLTLYAPNSTLTNKYRIIHTITMVNGVPHIDVRSKFPWEQRSSRKRLLLDSGYPGGIVLWNKKHFQKVTSKRERRKIGNDNSGVFTMTNLRFGKLIFEKMPIFIGSSTPEQHQKRDGLLGATILAQYKHVIDFKNKRLMLRRIFNSDGTIVQINIGGIYTPNNEKYITKTYQEHISATPKTIIYGDQVANSY